MNPATFTLAYYPGPKADRQAQRVRYVVPSRPGRPWVRRGLTSPGRRRLKDGALLSAFEQKLNHARLLAKSDRKIAAVAVSKSWSAQ